MSSTKSSIQTSSKSTEKSRREAVAVTQANIDRIDAGLDPSAEQVASIDVDPKVEIAAARKHAATARGKKTGKVQPPKKTKPAKTAKPKEAKADKAKKARKMSALDAAAQVLARRDKPMTTGALIEAMAAQHLWTSPGGKTPAATLNAAMIREITVKGRASRFKKAGRGLFAVAGRGAAK